MPNWCDNSLIITGDKAAIEEFALKMMQKSDGHFHFQDFYPNPYLEDNGDPKPNSGDAWYDWAVDHWGTKWDLNDEDTEVDIDDTRVTLFFQTAWSPPEEFVKKVSADYPNLDFALSYHEGMMAYCGYMEYRNGEAIRVLTQKDLGEEESEPFCHFYTRFCEWINQKGPNEHCECGGVCDGDDGCEYCEDFVAAKAEKEAEE
jgi:hypothetical protein